MTTYIRSRAHEQKAMPNSPPATEVTARKIVDAVDRLQLDLRGRHVLTEAATGAYAVTPVISALAGAKVTALAKFTRYGTMDDARRETGQLAARLGVADRIRVVETLADRDIAGADIVTNSGHLRPLDASRVRHMKCGAVIPLMYESWELRLTDIDLAACRERGVMVAGTNERHPALAVFEYLGMLSVHGLLQCEVPVANCRLLVISDNDFGPFIARTLVGCGGEVEILTSNLEAYRNTGLLPRTVRKRSAYDAVVLADRPGAIPSVGLSGSCKYTPEQVGDFPCLVQIWGDVDRTSLTDVRFYPEARPAAGHMGVLLSQLGPDPVVRLQAGGLKVGEVLARCRGMQLQDGRLPFEVARWANLVQLVQIPRICLDSCESKRN